MIDQWGPESQNLLEPGASRSVPCVGCTCPPAVVGLQLLCREGRAQCAHPAWLWYSCCPHNPDSYIISMIISYIISVFFLSGTSIIRCSSSIGLLCLLFSSPFQDNLFCLLCSGRALKYPLALQLVLFYNHIFNLQAFSFFFPILYSQFLYLLCGVIFSLISLRLLTIDN